MQMSGYEASELCAICRETDVVLSQLAAAMPVGSITLLELAERLLQAALQDLDGLNSMCRETDVVLSQLAAAMPVDIMPGPSDPSNHSLPQQPLHGCLLPCSSGFATLSRCGMLMLHRTPTPACCPCADIAPAPAIGATQLLAPELSQLCRPQRSMLFLLQHLCWARSS